MGYEPQLLLHDVVAGRMVRAAELIRRRHGLVLAVVTAAAGLLPLLVAAPAPLMDWPSHLARVWIIDRMLDGDAFWMDRYEFRGFLIPNVVLDLGVLGLMRLGLQAGTAGTVFLLMLYAAFIGGVARLAGRIGSASALTVPLAVTCFYSTLLFYGLVNFIAGLAAMAWALAVWCGLAERPGWRAGLAVVATAGIALCHILAALIFLGVVACLDLPGLLRRRSGWPARLLPCAVAGSVLVAILALSPVEAGEAGGIGFNAGGTLTGFLWRKAVILVRAMSSGQAGPDAVMLGTAGWLAAMAYRVRPPMPAAWALAACGLLGLSLVAPDTVGEGAFLDARLVPAALLLAAAAARWQRTGAGTAAVLAAAVVLRVGWLAAGWYQAGQSHGALDAALARLPRGSTLLAGLGTPGTELTWWQEWSPPAGNIASLAVPHGVFVPSVFASPSQQPLALRDGLRSWRHYQDVSTPALLREVPLRLPACASGSATFMLVLHVRPGDLGVVSPEAIMGPPDFPFALIRIC